MVSPSPNALQGLVAYHAYLRSRWLPRARLIGLLALVASPLWLLLDGVGGAVTGHPVPWGELARLRLPWVLLPATGLLLLRTRAVQRHVAPFALLTSSAYCLGNDWVFYRLGQALSAGHLVVVLSCFLCPITLLPLRTAGRWLLVAALGSSHLVLDLVTPDGRPLALKLWGNVLLLVGGGVITYVMHGLFRTHRRMFLLREEMKETLGALELSRGQVTGAVATLAGSVTQLTQGAQQLAEGSARSREASQQMAAATEEMARSARALQERSRGGAQSAEDAHAHTQAVGQLLTRVEAGVQEIDAAVARSEVSFRRLQAHAERIGRFVDGVQEMAAQTQMLAVNAGIEASRAGAQGAGFAVIAQEVRGLAQASASSSREVSSVVLELQRQVDGTVTSVDAVRERTRSFLAIYAQTRDSLGSVQGSVSAAEGAIRENASEAELQASATRAISANTLELLQRVEAQALLAQQVTATSNRLGALATGLRALLPATPAPAGRGPG